MTRGGRREGEPSHRGAFARMYRGETRFDFVGRRRWWFLLSGILIGLGLISLGYRGLNLGIDFRGGSAWTVSAPGVTQAQATDAVTSAGLSQPTVELLGRGANQQLEVQANINNLPGKHQVALSASVTKALADLTHHSTTDVSVTHVGPTWGGEITTRAVVALIAFFAAVVVYISFRFEPKMALAAFVAMIHDLLITVGVYSLAGFQVTPDTVIALLTILGYSLYDTVVVFDRVRENTKGVGATGRMTYSDMINLSMNQTLARSMNTSLVAILPVLAVLAIGAQLLGATTLQDYGLALFIGLLSGAYSSIFIASPVLAMLREREPRYRAIRQRIESRGDRPDVLSPAAAALATAGAALPGGGGVGGGGAGGGGSRNGGGGGRNGGGRSGVLRPGAARSAGGKGDVRAPSGKAQTGKPQAGRAQADGVPAEADGLVSPSGSAAGAGNAAPGGGTGVSARPAAGGPGRQGPRPRKGSKPRRRR